eukprot:gene28489-31645_t
MAGQTDPSNPLYTGGAAAPVPTPEAGKKPSAIFDTLSELEVSGPSDSKQRWVKATAKIKMANLVSGSFSTLRDQVDVNQIQLRNLKTLAKLGEGAFATVEKCEYTTPTGDVKIVAVKKLKPEIAQHPHEVQSFQNEVNLMRKLQHKNIIQYVGIGSVDTTSEKMKKDTMFLVSELMEDRYCIPGGIGCSETTSDKMKKETMFLVSELMEGGTLKKLILKQMQNTSKLYFSRSDAIRWSYQIAQALAYCHKAVPQVIHRDLKLENILLQGERSEEQVAKLADFGLAAFLRKEETTRPRPCLTPTPVITGVPEDDYNKGATEGTSICSCGLRTCTDRLCLHGPARAGTSRAAAERVVGSVTSSRGEADSREPPTGESPSEANGGGQRGRGHDGGRGRNGWAGPQARGERSRGAAEKRTRSWRLTCAKTAIAGYSRAASSKNTGPAKTTDPEAQNSAGIAPETGAANHPQHNQ